MHPALYLWDLARTRNTKELSKHVHWEAADRVRIDLQGGRSTRIATPQRYSRRLRFMRTGDVVRPALFYIQETINQHLDGRVSPGLLWDPKHERMSLYIMPESLIGALWLQFARAVDGNKKYERCAECKTWFEVSPDTFRTNRRYCKNACRFKAYRGRQAEARGLATGGMPVREIAKHLESDAKVVKSWIAKI